MKILKRILIAIPIVFFGSTIVATLILKWMPVYVSPLMIIRCVQQHSDQRPLKLKHHWVPYDSISPELPIAVMASEDQLFPKHNGFDKKAIIEAADEYMKGKRRRGGSTISQQTAKNVFLWPQSTWTRKALEAYFTVLIECFWSKERIMEVYLNTIEMGDGIYGAEAVAQENFNTSALQLNKRQCALIAATLPNPLKFDSKKPSPYMRKRQRHILKEMNYIRHTYKDTLSVDNNTK